tara:strand:- start:44 stop:514 length:471 start_codon:yes stop_codon:yes gene_type:complete
MNAFKIILNKLYSSDNPVFAVLKAENKLELAAIDDINSSIDEAENFSRNDEWQRLSADANDFMIRVVEFKELAQEYLTNYEDTDSHFSEFKIKMDALEENLNKYALLSEELGIDPSSNSDFQYGELILQDMQDEYREYDNSYDTIIASINVANRVL